MSDKRPVYLLAGGRPRVRKVPDPLIQAALRESGRVSPTIAYIGTANNDDEGFFNFIAESFREAGAYRVNHALISSEKANLKRAQDILKSADIIFMSGGDVDRGMRVLREKNMTDFLSELYEQGKSFFGSSAGSIMLAKEWVRWRDPEDNSTAELFPCLGFAPISPRLLHFQCGQPHWKYHLKESYWHCGSGKQFTGLCLVSWVY
jgi:peptidase E